MMSWTCFFSIFGVTPVDDWKAKKKLVAPKKKCEMTSRSVCGKVTIEFVYRLNTNIMLKLTRWSLHWSSKTTRGVTDGFLLCAEIAGWKDWTWYVVTSNREVESICEQLLWVKWEPISSVFWLCLSLSVRLRQCIRTVFKIPSWNFEGRSRIDSPGQVVKLLKLVEYNLRGRDRSWMGYNSGGRNSTG